MIAILRRAALRFHIRALEIQIDGMGECLDCVADPILLGRIELARSRARRELATARGRYNALLPLARRRTWRLA